MADSFSDIFKIRKPQVGTTGWGPKLNLDIDHLDTALVSFRYANPAPSAGNLVVNVSNGLYQAATLTSTTDVSFSTWALDYTDGATAGPTLAQRVMLRLTVSGSPAVTWTGVTWLTGTAPVLTNGENLLEFVSWDHGATILGWVLPGTASITPGMLTVIPSGFLGGVSPTTTSATSLTTLGTVVIPAGLLDVNNKGVRIRMVGHSSGSSVQFSKLAAKFGATTVFNLLILGGSYGLFEAIVTRMGAATQVSVVTSEGSLVGTPTTPAETLSGAVTVTLQGMVSTGSVVCSLDQCYVELI